MNQIYIDLKNISEIENFLTKEIIERDRLYKKFKRAAQALVYIDHGLLSGNYHIHWWRDN